MTRTQLMQDKQDVISDKVKNQAYKAWYIMSLPGKEIGTIFKSLPIR